MTLNPKEKSNGIRKIITRLRKVEKQKSKWEDRYMGTRCEYLGIIHKERILEIPNDVNVDKMENQKMKYY